MEICHLHDVVTVYGCIVSSYLSSNDDYSSRIRNTLFHSATLPPLSLRDYLERIYRYFNCSGECYVLSLIYIDKLIKLDSFVINIFSVYRVIITSLMLAAKFFDDVYYTNAFYAEVGGISVEELNLLEVDFLCKIRFNLFVTPQEFQKYYEELQEHCSLCSACRYLALPTLYNSTPFDETPILRFRKHRTIAADSFSSDVLSPTDYYGSNTPWSSAAEYCSVPWAAPQSGSVIAYGPTYSSQGVPVGWDVNLTNYSQQAAYVNKVNQEIWSDFASVSRRSEESYGFDRLAGDVNKLMFCVC